MPELAARLIAFYLPQYHPIPENDEFWGKGFTEWTNVTKAKPLFPGHHQPKLPADLGFYDLRVPEIRAAQANLAQQAGIEGFCYWHYWFGNGKRVMNRIFDEVVQTGEPNFPFCLGWANESWTGVWHGMSEQVLIPQTYPGEQDSIRHFECVLPAFLDERYLRVNDCPIFLIYKPHHLPDVKKFVHTWQSLAKEAGLKGIYFIGRYRNRADLSFGMGGLISTNPWTDDSYKASINHYASRVAAKLNFHLPELFNYKKYVEIRMKNKPMPYEHPVVVPNWDNSPRSKYRSKLFYNATPKLYEKWLRMEVEKIQFQPIEQRIIFLKSWNEWAEGNYLEPCRTYGHQYLKATKAALQQS